jgi:hypothetical protein
MIKFRIPKDDFTLEIGQNGWYRDHRNGKWYNLIICSEGIFFDGEILAEGKLKLNLKHKELA